MRLPSVGLLGRIIFILAFLLCTEFVVNTLLFEQVSRFVLRDDRAQRAAENLVVAHRLMDRTPAAGRPELAQELSNSRLTVNWRRGIDTQPTNFRLQELGTKMLAFEPYLSQKNLRLHLRPLHQGGEIGGSLELSDHSTLVFRTKRQEVVWPLTLGRIAALALPMLALALIGGVMIRSTLRPLRVLMKATNKVGEQEPRALQEHGPSEVRAFIRDFNAMQLRIHRLVASRTQALAAIGHDLRTPLARMELRLHGTDLEEQERQALLGDVGEMDDLLRSLQVYLSGDSERMLPEKVDLAAMALTIIEGARDTGKDAHYEGPSSLEILVRPVSIRRAISNLVENAVQYGSTARLTIRQDEDATLVIVEDDGPGIDPDQLDAVLQPFVRLDQGRARNTRGMGLGLPIVDNAMRQEGGQLILENSPEGGLRATLRLPHPEH